MNKNFFMISNRIYEYRLPPSAFAGYCYLVKCKGKNNSCYPSRETIADNCNMSVRTVDSALKILINEGLVEKMNTQRETNAYTSNVY